ncbi:hypothetical protein HDV00_009193 [Rhizophlyctis rosea]|nr:hypothetical protein HDV00_009193 [Rhizophlyctis rosea]
MLFEYANVDDKKVGYLGSLVFLESNWGSDLLIDDLDRFGLFWDVITEFELEKPISPVCRRFTRQLQSGREAADWAAAHLEEEGRLIV